MRYRVYAIVNLIILVFYVCRPVIPYIEYAVLKDYISKNLCVNKDNPKSCCRGKCYLEKQLKESAETSDTEEKSSNKKITTQEINEFLISPFSIPKVAETSLPPKVHSEIMTDSQVVTSVFVPPKA